MSPIMAYRPSTILLFSLMVFVGAMRLQREEIRRNANKNNILDNSLAFKPKLPAINSEMMSSHKPNRIPNLDVSVSNAQRLKNFRKKKVIKKKQPEKELDSNELSISPGEAEHPSPLSSDDVQVLQADMRVDHSGYNTHLDTRDKFLCGKCICAYNTYELISANCSYAHNLFDFPNQFPKKTIHINLSHNKIGFLNQSNIVVLKNLRMLYMRFNSIKEIVTNTSRISQLLFLDIGYNKIENLKMNNFFFLPNLRYLSLQSNWITHIPNKTFLSLSKLRNLDLSFNRIVIIDGTAFDPLVSLRELYLYHNKQLGYSVRRFPPSLFDKLKDLEILFIQGNAHGDIHYPVKALVAIKSLQRLNIDILSNPVFLGPDMLQLKELTTLEFGPYCFCHKFDEIPADFFQYVPNVKILVFDKCLFHKFNPEAFRNLPLLNSLSFIHIDTYSLETAFQDLKGLQNSSLHNLKLIYLGQGGGELPCISLNGNHAKYLQNLPLSELDISKNQIAVIRDDFIQGLPTTLKKWVISYNLLTMKRLLWGRLGRLVNLVELDVTEQSLFHYKIPRETNVFQSTYNLSAKESSDNNTFFNNLVLERYEYETSQEKLGNNIQFIHEYDSNIISKSDDVKHISQTSCNEDTAWKVSLTSKQESATSDNKFNIHIPKSLRIVKASYYAFFGNHILESTDSNLEVLSLSNSQLRNWGHRTVPLSVKYVDFNENYCKYLSQFFFRPNNSLEHITMSSNLLGNVFATYKNGYLFTHLDRTKYMDISSNFIYKLPYFFLRGLISLETLRMTDNRLQDLNISFAATPNLRFLDLRRNSISWISKQTRNDLDKIAMRHHVTIGLEHNPIACTCEGIEMIHWLAMTNVHLLDRALLQCRDEFGNYHFMGNISLRHKTLINRCMGTTSIIISLSISISFFTLIVVCYYIGKRYKWWFYVKYKKNVWFAKHFGFKPKDKGRPTKEYLYDAYLCCSEEDRKLAIKIAEKLDKTNPLFIPFARIIPGMDEASGVTSGIINSHKFIIVFTENFKHILRTDFKDDSMLEYTINGALFQESSSRRQFLHVMMFSDTEDVQIPLYLARVLSDPDRLTTFPQDYRSATPEVLDCVWASLSSCISQKDKREAFLSSTSSSSRS